MNLQRPCVVTDIDYMPRDVRHMIEALRRLLDEFGFDEFHGGILTGEWGPFRPQKSINPTGEAGGAINVIPAIGAPGLCCPTLLAVARGTRGPLGLGQVMRQIRAHLIQCSNPLSGHATKTVVLVFDKYERRTFWESRMDWETHNAFSGVQFIKAYWNGHSLSLVP